MMPSTRVIFINRFYWPDSPATAQLLTDLAEALAAECRVTVLTSGAKELATHETHAGVDIVRLAQRGPNRASLQQRFVDFRNFRQAVSQWLEVNLHAGDVLVALTDPPLIGTTAADAARPRGVKVVQWVQDIFPEIAASVFGLPLLNAFRRSRDVSWRNAERCVTPGHAMREFLIDRGVAEDHVQVVPNWSPLGLAPAAPEAVHAWKQEHGLAEAFVVMYSGNLGRAHEFAWLVPVARELLDDPKIVFVFAGRGPRLRHLEEAVIQGKLPNVRFIPKVPRESLAPMLTAGDVHLVSLREGCENLVYPSKLAGIAAVGRPALVVGPPGCEAAHEVTAGGWGRGYALDEVEAITTTIRNWKQNPTLLADLGAHALAAAARIRFETALSAWKAIIAAARGSSLSVNETLTAP